MKVPFKNSEGRFYCLLCKQYQDEDAFFKTYIKKGTKQCRMCEKKRRLERCANDPLFLKLQNFRRYAARKNHTEVKDWELSDLNLNHKDLLLLKSEHSVIRPDDLSAQVWSPDKIHLEELQLGQRGVSKKRFKTK